MCSCAARMPPMNGCSGAPDDLNGPWHARCRVPGYWDGIRYRSAPSGSSIMNTRQDKAVDMLLSLGDPAERRTRSQLLDLALRMTLTLTEADAAAILTPSSRRGERLVLHAGSSTPATLQLTPKGSEVVKTLTESAQPLVLLDLLDDSRIAGADCCPG